MPAPSPWKTPQVKKSLVVRVADMVASNDPGAELVTYSLGSCLGVTVYDPVTKAGGLLHLMLPNSTINPRRAEAEPYMFVDTGVPRLFKAVYRLGGERSRVIVKVAGGAEFLDPNRVFNIGERNYEQLRALLAHNGYAIHAADVGGTCSRTMRLDLATGRVSLSSPGFNPYDL